MFQTSVLFHVPILTIHSRHYFVSVIVRKVKMRGDATLLRSGGNEGSHSFEAAVFIHCTDLFCLNLVLDSVIIVCILLDEAVDIYSESSYRSTMEGCLPSNIEIGECVVSTC